MKRIAKNILLIAIALILPAITSSENRIITVSSGEWPPFLSENMKHHGLAARIISESFALQNITAKYGWFPWKRTYNNVRTGNWDASAVWAITEERSKEVFFSDPIIESKIVIFFNKATFLNWNSFEDLSGIVIGATNGYFYGEEFQQAEENGLIIVERTSLEVNNFKKLAANRIDAVIAEIDTGYDIMHRLFRTEQIGTIVVSPRTVASFSNHLVISKKLENGEQLVATFNKGLKQLTESGKVEQYLIESRKGLYRQGNE